MTILETIKDIIVDADSTIDASRIEPSARLIEDLGIDSLTVAMISVEIEDRFNIEIDTEQKFETVGEVCDYIEELSAAHATA